MLMLSCNVANILAKKQIKSCETSRFRHIRRKACSAVRIQSVTSCHLPNRFHTQIVFSIKQVSPYQTLKMVVYVENVLNFSLYLSFFFMTHMQLYSQLCASVVKGEMNTV